MRFNYDDYGKYNDYELRGTFDFIIEGEEEDPEKSESEENDVKRCNDTGKKVRP